MTKSKKKKVSKQLVGADYADAIGKTTMLALTWKDWKKELPVSGDTIYVIVKLEDGYYPVTGVYLDEVFPAVGPFKETRWQQVKFDDMATAILGGENGETLFAWAKAKKIGKMFDIHPDLLKYC